jgi:hypothetical protein
VRNSFSEKMLALFERLPKMPATFRSAMYPIKRSSAPTDVCHDAKPVVDDAGVLG